MYEMKTKINNTNVLEFLNNLENKKRKDDSLIILNLMEKITGEQAKMWGESIIGFGLYPSRNKNGQVSEWMKIGFSPRKQYLALYFMNGYQEYDVLLGKLGKHKTSKACLYINKLTDIDISILQTLIKLSYDYVTTNYI